MKERTLINNLSEHVAKKVTVVGWVNSVRDHNKVIFFDLRDYTGTIQIVATSELKEFATLKDIKEEWIISVSGEVKQRPNNPNNKESENGSIEIEAQSIDILSKAATPPFELSDTSKVNEELRLEYRYLDIRSRRMQKNLRLRSKINLFFRNYLDKQGFAEIETPNMSKSTPEGARDFLVPSRKYQGKFYALPQSPQQYKQLLMVGGIERYYQMARCFRDEDQRGQRQPEFTQLDIEMSFADQEDIMSLVESMLIELIETELPEKKLSTKPFTRLTHDEAKEKYGNDKPDLRQNKDDENELAFCWVTDFPMFEYKKGDKRWGAEHNPFTMPKEEGHQTIMDVAAGKKDQSELENICAAQYDLSLNGNEIFGGAVRNHNPELLKAVFQALGHSEAEVEDQFGHMLKAFTFGVPPHAGIASGHDRLVMVLANEPNIREVIAFPKNGEAYDPMMKSPSDVSTAQLKELGLNLSASNES